MGEGLLSLAKCRLAPTVKHTGQESGGELCEIFKFWSFLQSKSVNNVWKLFQLLGDFIPQIPYRGFASRLSGLYPQMKISGAPLVVITTNTNIWYHVIATKSVYKSVTAWLTAERHDAGVWRSDTQILVAERRRLQRLKQRLTDEHSDRSTEAAADSQSAATDAHPMSLWAMKTETENYAKRPMPLKSRRQKYSLPCKTLFKAVWLVPETYVVKDLLKGTPVASKHFPLCRVWGMQESWSCIRVKVFVRCLLCVILFWIFFILACRRHVCCQGHGSRSNVIVSYVKDSH